MSRLSFILIILLTALTQSTLLKAGNQQIDRPRYYAALRSDDLKKINFELEQIQKLKGELIEAFEGALLMKKAGILKNPKEKLELFKQGNKKLESMIGKQPSNAELHFLRLIIQENAPKMLGYHHEKAEDAAMIVKHFKNFPDLLRQEVLNYAMKSAVLKQEDLKAHE